jgi:hypothetical protein
MSIFDIPASVNQNPADIFKQMAPSIFPSVADIQRGAIQDHYGKTPINVTQYNVEVFDMSKEDDRKRYTDIMIRLIPMSQNVKCVICRNELQIVNGFWWRYLEWFEYKLNDSSLTTEFKSKEQEQIKTNDTTGNNNDNDSNDDTESGNNIF